MKPADQEHRAPLALRAVAAFEICKGGLVVLLGLGLLSLIHQDVQATAEKLMRTLHLDPAWQVTHMVLKRSAELTDHKLVILALYAFGYSAIRFIEGFGLWHNRSWAEWFAVLSACLFLPLEIQHLLYSFDYWGVAVFVGNLLIVGYLVHILRQKHLKRQAKP